MNTVYPNSLSPAPGHSRCLFLCLVFLALAGVPRDASAQETMIVLNEAQENVSFNAQVATAGTAPYTWTVLQGVLPPGLTLQSNGQLSGMPAANSHSTTPYRFKVRVTDSSAPPLTSDQWLSVAVTPPPSLITPPGARLPAPVPVPAAPPPFILTSSTADEETIALARQFAASPQQPTFDSDTSDTNVGILRQIIATTVGNKLKPANSPVAGPSEFEVGDYCAMHTIVWQQLADNKSEPDREIWALFRAVKENDATVRWEPVIDKKNPEIFDTRIFGRKRVVVLLAHLNTPAAWDVKYKVTVTQKIPVPIQHALELASAITGGGPREATGVKDIWGARLMLIKYTASEIVVKVNAVTSSTGRPVEQSKEHSKSYDNEGKYHWDVSVGLPVQSVRELRFKSEGNRVTAESKERQSVYGFLDLYPKAVDLKGDSFFTFPHLVLGVPLASKPLQRPFVGLGTGLFKLPIKFNIFGGIVFIRERVPGTLGEGSTATTGQLESDLHTRWVRKFMFGFNLPASQIKDAIKSK